MLIYVLVRLQQLYQRNQNQNQVSGPWHIHIDQPIGIMVKPRFNPRLSHTKYQKRVLDSSLLNTQNYNAWIKSKWSNLGKREAPPPTPQCNSYWKRSLQVTHNYGLQTYIYVCVCMCVYNIYNDIYIYNCDSNISFTERDNNICMGKMLTTIDRLLIILKSDPSNKIKWDFFQTVVLSILLLHSCTP